MRFFLKVICFSLFVFSCSSKPDGIYPEVKNLTEAVYASVTIQPDSLYQVYATVSGILDMNMIDEGDIVKKGQPIIQVINNAPKLNSENSRLALDLAKNNYEGNAAILSSLEDEIVAAELNFKNDSINYFRQKKLWSQKIGSKAEYDSKNLKYELSRNNLNLLKRKYNITRNELNTALMQAENNFKSAQINTNDYTIESKINGKIYALYKNPGELVNTMEPIASIGRSNKFIVEMLVDELDIVKIELNQEVIIALDAYKDSIFKAKVSKVFPQKDIRNQTFKVEASFEKSPSVLYPGLSGEASIIISEKKNVLTIPKYLLFEDNKVKTDDGFKMIEVGSQNLEYVEVLSGIDENTIIYKE